MFIIVYTSYTNYAQRVDFSLLKIKISCDTVKESYLCDILRREERINLFPFCLCRVHDHIAWMNASDMQIQ